MDSPWKVLSSFTIREYEFERRVVNPGKTGRLESRKPNQRLQLQLS